MASRANLLKRYPYLCDPKLPHIIGCPVEQSIDEAKLVFKRVCYKDAIIVAVEAVKGNCIPVCIWRVCYQMKNKDYDYKEDDSNSNIFPPKLPMNEVSLGQFFEDLTLKRYLVDVEVYQKFYSEDCLTAIVEYFPKTCECQCKNFNMVVEEPRIWPIKEAEVNFRKLKIHK